MEAPYTIPSPFQLHPSVDPSPQARLSQKKPRQTHMHSFRSQTSRERQDVQSHEVSRAPTTASSRSKKKWWRIKLFRGMINDARRRAPYYWSDWRDAFDYRVCPATVYMYFTKYGPQSIKVSSYHSLAMNYDSFPFLKLLTFNEVTACLFHCFAGT